MSRISHDRRLSIQLERGAGMSIQVKPLLMNRADIVAAYLEYRNDYLSPAVWGEHRGLDTQEAIELLHVMRVIAYGEHPDA